MGQSRHGWVAGVLLAGAAGMLCSLAGCQNTRSADEAVAHYVAARLAAERDPQAALAELAKALAADPALAVAHEAIGDIHRKACDYSQAADAYEKACAANPYAFKPHYHLGLSYERLAALAREAQASADYIARAVLVYLRALEIRPADFDANLNLSACYFQQGKLQLAEEYCRIATNVNPRSEVAYANLGVIYDAQDRPWDAIRAYKESLELDTHQAPLLVNLAIVYARLNRFDDAVKTLRLATDEDPACAGAWEALGNCYFNMRQWDQAVESYRKALASDARSAPAHRGLGVVYMSQFVLDTARDDLRRKALDCWNRSLELDPHQPQLLQLVQKYQGPPDLPRL